MSTVRILRANRDLVVLIAVVLLVMSFVTVRTYALYENRLSVYGEWTSTKTMRLGVMGAIAFVSGQQALARNRLNLGAWFGFQEVLYREALDLAAVQVRFRNDEDGYVHLLFDHRADGFSGVRLSSSRDSPSLAYRATPEGEFTQADTLPQEPVPSRAWHTAKLAFTTDSVVVALNGTEVGTFARLAGPQRIGFRGGQRNAWIDAVILTRADGQVYTERFSNSRRQWPRLAMSYGVFALLTAAVLAAVIACAHVAPRLAMMGLVSGVLVATSVLAAAYTLQYVQATDYNVPTGRYNRAAPSLSDPDVIGGIRRRYSPEVPPNTFSILMLGSSQTWGAGAHSEAETWVRQLESALNRSSREPRFEIVNAGISGFRAEDVLALLRNDLDWLATDAALVNLSSNDVDTLAFRQNMDALARELTARGIRTVFALEANTPERRVTDSEHGDLVVKHTIMRDVAARYGFPVIDLHGHLAMHRDAGFLWWDFVHLAPFGQLLVAHKLARDLPLLLLQ
jgi:lysophospholipase L1-like esterase